MKKYHSLWPLGHRFPTDPFSGRPIFIGIFHLYSYTRKLLYRRLRQVLSTTYPIIIFDKLQMAPSVCTDDWPCRNDHTVSTPIDNNALEKIHQLATRLAMN